MFPYIALFTQFLVVLNHFDVGVHAQVESSTASVLLLPDASTSVWSWAPLILPGRQRQCHSNQIF